MILSMIWACLAGLSVICAIITGNGSALSAAAAQGAQKGVTLAVSIAGSLCLWAGIGHLCQAAGITDQLARMLSPVLRFLFPECRSDPILKGYLSANVCANLLGLGNAATPAGIRAARCLADPLYPGKATAGLCRLVVLNTASIQLIPTTVAAVRASLGCSAPFDILPGVWVTSVFSAAAGLTAARCMERIWPES